MSVKLFRPSPTAVAGYELLEKIGEGGMGAVFKGRHQTTGQLAAIKFIAAALVEDFTQVQRFEQEFRVAANLLHPNIVRVLEFDQSEDGAYLVMEYVDGESLEQCIARDGPLPEADAILLITQVAQALDHAHRHQVIHRDVKPANILLTADGQVKLGDFGLVKDIIGDRHLTEPMTGLGTVHFVAPEQYHDARHVNARADIYSLAATLYMAVTGQKPFGNCRTLAAAIQHALNGTLTPPRLLVPQLSEEIDGAILQAMHRDPAQRPRSCLEFLRSLKRRKKRRSPRSTPTAPRPMAPGKECRAAVRYPFEQGTACGVERSLHPGNAETPECWPAFVQDISRGGLAMVLGRRLETGTVVTVDLEFAGNTPPRSLQARVMHVRRCAFGQCHVGCAFLEPLSEADVQRLL